MKWILGLLCLFFLIIFHEFGHFLAAKLFGVKVESFSVGFGPVLLHKRIRGTDFRLSLIPLGGYCGMKGEQDFRTAVECGLSSIEGEPDSLYGAHPLKRAAIGFAGPFFNLIFAVTAFALINLIGYTYHTYSNRIILADELFENTVSAAREAGLLTGDQIIEINGKPVEDFSDIYDEVAQNPDRELAVKVLRDGMQLDFTVHSQLDKDTGTGKIGVAADSEQTVERHTPHYNPATALWQGALDSLGIIRLTFKSIGILFKGVKLQNAVSGPARVTDMLGTTIKEGFGISARTGIISLLNLMAIISVSLFIMNLLPVPLLDGGLILAALTEAVSRRKLNPRFQYYLQFVGVAFIAILFIIGLIGDISYFVQIGRN